ncbi:hypothetical protein CS0771_34980 [Catellatospora sp. IY07-71]|nr:hypothetical protein CS0771_34980 [Catellatospora sp. IY07-71]
MLTRLQLWSTANSPTPRGVAGYALTRTTAHPYGTATSTASAPPATAPTGPSNHPAAALTAPTWIPAEPTPAQYTPIPAP